MSRQHICIIAFKDVRRTIHVLKQIDYLSREFDLTVVGYGDADPSWQHVVFRPIPKPTRTTKLMRLLPYLAGKVAPAAYRGWHLNATPYRQALAEAVSSKADVFHANDLIALPVAVEAARRTGGKVVAHLHEYSLVERDNEWLWRRLVKPAFAHLLGYYTSRPEAPIAGSITVCQPIADRYKAEWGLDPIVSYNAPRPVDAPVREETGERVRMVHHGFAKRGRGLHNLVRAVGLADQRFTLDFMLVEDDPGYLEELNALAEQVAPGRVVFRDPVKPHEIVATVSEYTLGLSVIEPTTYNNLMMLPNKFFEYVQGGLALCVGPSPAMVDLVDRHGFGVHSPSFSPEDVAATLNALTPLQIQKMRAAARSAAAVLNADVEMGKILQLYRDLFALPRAKAA